MDIFIHGIPPQATNLQVNTVLTPHLFHFKIRDFQCHKPKSKGFAYLYINDRVQGKHFLDAYAARTDVRLSHKFHMTFKLSSRQDSGAQLRDERFREQMVLPAAKPLNQAVSGTQNLSIE
jgi:hypothetical protein